MKHLFLLTALLTTACSTTAPEADVASATAGNAGQAEEVCLLLKLTGTNIPKKYCRTPGEWEQLAANDRDIAREFLSQTQQRSGILEAADPSPF